MGRSLIRVAGLAALLVAATASSAAVPSPEEFLGRKVGEDRFLASWEQVVAYHRVVAEGSPRVAIESAGTSTLGNEIPVVIVTSEANQSRLDRIREIARQLANADRLTPADIDRLVEEGRTIVLVTCTIHGNEVGSTQMTMELVHELATSRDPEIGRWLDQVVLLVMPSINPDGQVLEIEWYHRWLGTEYEGSSMPWLYHPYVGHDDNRDFYMLTQKETRAVNDLIYHRWFPHIFLDEHQMGSTGPRMFVPPQADPLADEVHPLVFRQADLLGTAMAMRLEEHGLTGVGSDMIFDSYWPGGTRNTAWWKNVTGLLTEVASAQRATPIFVDPNELRGSAKGLPEYRRQANFPSPWPGGWWRLRDIIDYELVATKALLETAAHERRSFLRNLATIAREAAQRGRTQAPFAFLVPPEQHDPVAAGRLVELMLRHGVRVWQSVGTLEVGASRFPAGTWVLPADQPYREFLMTMLRPQRYPEVVPFPDGPVLEPYDATTWSLPISMGVTVVEADGPVSGKVKPLEHMAWPEVRVGPAKGGWLLPHAADSVFLAMNRLLARGSALHWLERPLAGSVRGDVWVPPDAISRSDLQALVDELHIPVVALDLRPSGPALAQRPVRVGLFKPWRASMDEGWTRFLLEQNEFPFVTLTNDDLRSGGFTARADLVLLPDVEATVIVKGEPSSERAQRWSTPLPPEYSGGIGPEGNEHLKGWVVGGGTVVAINGSVPYLIELFDLPVEDLRARLSSKDITCPGAMLRLEVDTAHPLAYGMRQSEAGYFDGSPILATRVPDGRFTRTVVARYPHDARDVLISGWLEGAEHLERRAAVVEVRVGKGRVVLIAFKPQNRAQTHRTFKLLFNALYLPGLEEVELP